ncbi:MAG: amidohydrolase [Lachnospiraceae bacterium]
MNRKKILEAAETILPYATDIREYFHRNPELSFREHKTAEFIEKELTNAGISFVRAGKTGVVASVRGERKQDHRILALRSDMDALPVREESQVSYRSLNSNMHACGHDMHMAMLLAAGRVLHENREQLRGTVKLVFQPAEETGEGADAIIASGEVCDVDCILALHMNPKEETGIFHTGYGVRTSSGICADITITGETNRIVICAAELLQIIGERAKALIGRENVPYSFVPTVVKMSGDTQVRIFYDGRIFREEDGGSLTEIISNTADLLQGLYQVKTDCKFIRIGGAVENDGESVDRAAMVIRELFGEKALQITPPARFGEDFRQYGAVIPRLIFSMLGGAGSKERYPLHSSRVTFSNEALFYGIAYYLGYVERYFEEEES